MKYIKPVVGKDVDNNESNHFSETYDKRFHTNIPVTFGQVFAPGDVPAGLSVKVNVGGNPLQTQVDDKATHPDGSLRHAVITAWLPALGAGQSLA
ncbi:MAG TPA: hypothetical protein ENI94_11810, partial [Gammaproteobacteria bacterium]|nr:hypothetical protein [Gammaproteobacteria bacterium]